jgi:hypothetical protein
MESAPTRYNSPAISPRDGRIWNPPLRGTMLPQFPRETGGYGIRPYGVQFPRNFPAKRANMESAPTGDDTPGVRRDWIISTQKGQSRTPVPTKRAVRDGYKCHPSPVGRGLGPAAFQPRREQAPALRGTIPPSFSRETGGYGIRPYGGIRPAALTFSIIPHLRPFCKGLTKSSFGATIKT